MLTEPGLVYHFLIIKEIISPNQIRILETILQSSTKIMTVLLIKHKIRKRFVPFFFFNLAFWTDKTWIKIGHDGLNLAKPNPTWRLPSLTKAVPVLCTKQRSTLWYCKQQCSTMPLNGLAIFRTFFLTPEQSLFLLEHSMLSLFLSALWMWKTFG